MNIELSEREIKLILMLIRYKLECGTALENVREYLEMYDKISDSILVKNPLYQ